MAADVQNAEQAVLLVVACKDLLRQDPMEEVGWTPKRPVSADVSTASCD